jgi:hypothetical protein
VDGAFGAVVGRQPGAWTQSGGRSDINDDAAAPLAERWDDRLTSEENPLHIDSENSVVFRLAYLHRRLVHVRRSGIVDEDIEGAESRERFLNYAIYVGFLAHVTA